MDTQKIGLRIAQARQSQRLTQQQLAEQLCVTNKAISKWERGTSLPDVALPLPLCRILGMTVQELLDDDTARVERGSNGCLWINNKRKGDENTENGAAASPYFGNMEKNTVQNLYIDYTNCTELSPYIFGHNLEHTRACVCGGLSAQMLRNRKFAGKPSKQEGCCQEWFPIGKRVFFLTEDPWCRKEIAPYTRHMNSRTMNRKNELQSMAVQNLIAGEPAGFGQDELSILAGKTYEMRVAATASAPIALTVSLTSANGLKTYARTQITINTGDWQNIEFTLVPDTTDEHACLRYTFTDYGKIIFGAVSMMEEGHFRGMRRDIIEKMKEIGIGMLRWPGGNFAGEYRWMDGLLPVDQRGPLESFMEEETHPYTHGYDTHEINTDDFIALCREIGAEPFLTVNLYWDTPEESAAWVEYCNGSTDTVYGRLRAERGFPEPFNVKYWSLGNEMGYGHMEGPMTPESYVGLARAKAEAMLKVTPDLTLFSSGPYPDKEWTARSVKPLSDIVSHVSLHHYSYSLLDYSTPEAALQTSRNIIDNVDVSRQVLHTMRESLPDGIHISFDEWNYWYAWFRPSCTAEGLFAAGMIHMLLTDSNPCDAPVCCYFQPVGEGAIHVNKKDSYLTAIGQVMSLMKAHKGGSLCPIENVTNLEAVATRKDDILTLTLINKDVEEAKDFSANLCGEIISAKVLTAADLLPHSTFTEEDLPVTAENEMLQVHLPKHSVALIQIRC